MPFPYAVVKHHLREFAFGKLFNELGWDRPGAGLEVTLDGRTFHFKAVAEKRGLQVFECMVRGAEEFPDYAMRRKLERQVAKLAAEHLLIFTDAGRTCQTWQWVRRDPSGLLRYREHTFVKGQTGDALAQKLQILAFGIEEEEEASLVEAKSRTDKAFYAEKVTKQFFVGFEKEHKAFLSFVQGIKDAAHRAWYASLMLNRLMFIYFMRQRRFL